MATIRNPYWQRFWRHPNFISENWSFLALVLVLFFCLLAANVYFGHAKLPAEIDRIDVVGESATVFLFLLALLLLCYSRPRNSVTFWLAIGLICMVLATAQDAMDEWWRIPDSQLWPSLIESLPVGLVFIAVGLKKWLVIHWQTQQFFRMHDFSPEHRVDSETALPDWSTLVARLQQNPKRYLTFLLLEPELAHWNISVLKSLLTKEEWLCSFSKNRLVIAHDQLLDAELDQCNSIFMQHPSAVRILWVQKKYQWPLDQAAWMATSELNDDG